MTTTTTDDDDKAALGERRVMAPRHLGRASLHRLNPQDANANKAITDPLG
jgi:hypothetical protein